MPRFFCPQALALDTVITLLDDVARHIQVIRLTEGNRITLFNGEGGEYIAVITAIEKKQVSAVVELFEPREIELPYAITLAQALPEASKMDWIVEKAVELGVQTIQPLASQRCVVRLSAERAEKKLQHWRGIVIAASEQCGRNRLTAVAETVDFNQWTQRQDMHVRVMLSPRAGKSLSEWARQHPPHSVTLMIGPEGGFTEKEEDQATAQGVMLLSMGPRVLRTETAGIAALSVLNAIWGGM